MDAPLDSLLLVDQTESTSTPDLESQPRRFTLRPQQDYLDSLEDSMLHLDNTVNTTQDVRRKMLEKFMPVIEDMDVETNMAADPDLFQAQSRFISEMRGLLNDMDTASKNKVSIKLKKVDIESQKQSNIDAAAILNELKLTNTMITQQLTQNAPKVTEQEIEKKLEEQYNSAEMDIPDTELEVGGSQLPIHNSEEGTEDQLTAK